MRVTGAYALPAALLAGASSAASAFVCAYTLPLGGGSSGAMRECAIEAAQRTVEALAVDHGA